MQNKISAARIMQVYAEVPGVLRALAEERDDLRTKLAEAEQRIAEYETQRRIEKIAHKMEEKHLDLGTSFEDKIERIKQAAENGKSLDVIEEAVELAAPRAEFGRLGDEQSASDGELLSYILGGLSE